jgi:hypothetical protein
VGDEQHPHLAPQLVHGLGKVFGGVLVQVAGGFVEDEDFGLLEQGPGDGQALLLSAREAGAMFADGGPGAEGVSFGFVFRKFSIS